MDHQFLGVDTSLDPLLHPRSPAQPTGQGPGRVKIMPYDSIIHNDSVQQNDQLPHLPHLHDMDHAQDRNGSTYSHNYMYPQQNVQQNIMEVKSDLVAPIPPLHIQQQIVNSDVPAPFKEEPATSGQVLRSSCSRCKKDFVQPIIVPLDNTKALAEPKIFKLCQHCRDLQRQRSRRWQKKTKDKRGACRRCGAEIPPEEQKFVLCPSCRQNLRTRKANRAAQGKCVHCSGPLDASIITDKKDANANKSGNYKVCQRCRENDKIRRTNLERMGNCNRCAKALDPEDQGKHKVCLSCRSRKKKLNQTSAPVIHQSMQHSQAQQAQAQAQMMAQAQAHAQAQVQAQVQVQMQIQAAQQAQVQAAQAAQVQAALALDSSLRHYLLANPSAAQNLLPQASVLLMPNDQAMMMNGSNSTPTPMNQQLYNQAVQQQQQQQQQLQSQQQQQQQYLARQYQYNQNLMNHSIQNNYN